MKRHTVFISHAHSDNRLCDRYIAALLPYGLDIWYDRTNLQPGNFLSHSIEKELNTRSALVVLLSPAAINSNWVRLETTTYLKLAAHDSSRIIVPVRIEDCMVPETLQKFPLLDAVKEPFESVIRQLTHLLGGISTIPFFSRRVIRRSILGVGVGIVGLVVIGSGTTWWLAAQKPPIGKKLLTYHGHTEAVEFVSWSPNGKYIASSGDKTVQIWDATTENRIFTYRGHLKAVFGVAWSPDSKRIASASIDATVQLWDALTGGDPLTYGAHTDLVTSASWSADGKYIASASKDKTVHVWNAATGQTIFIYRDHQAPVSTAIWSPDGRLIASGGSGAVVRVWFATTGKLVLAYRGHSDGCSATIILAVGCALSINVRNVKN